MLFLRGSRANTGGEYRRKNMMHGAPCGVNRFLLDASANAWKPITRGACNPRAAAVQIVRRNFCFRESYSPHVLSLFNFLIH